MIRIENGDNLDLTFKSKVKQVIDVIVVSSKWDNNYNKIAYLSNKGKLKLRYNATKDNLIAFKYIDENEDNQMISPNGFKVNGEIIW